MQKDFSYPLTVSDISSAEKKYTINANAEECAVLAEILKVPAIKKFAADVYTKMKNKSTLLEVWGRVDAVVTRQSVISLDFFDKAYQSEFSLVFDTKATPQMQKEMEEELGDDTPDIVLNGTIDLVQIASEQLALELEDYPRKDGEAFNFKSEFTDDEDERKNPFKILEKLKK